MRYESYVMSPFYCAVITVDKLMLAENQLNMDISCK